jgi:hypothetical protein
MRKRLAIVGLGPSSHKYIDDVDRAGDRKALFDETWTFNSFVSVIASDRLFHMDDVKIQELRAKAGNVRVKNMLEAMKRYEGPIYTSSPEPEYPSMVPYPLPAVVARYNSLYFSTTPPYAAAYAGLEEWKEICLYGLDYTWPGVAGAEGGRGCMEYWVGRLQGQGIKVRVHETSSLLDARLSTKDDIKLYGFDRYRISLEVRGPDKLALLMEPKPLPTAEEIEERYCHKKPASDVALDVVN